MKKIKLYLAAMLLALLAIVVPPPASADPAIQKTGKITIANPEDGVTYTAYRLFDLSFDEAKGHYGYTVNSEWNGFFTKEPGKDFVTIDPTHGNVTLKYESAAEMQRLADAAKSHASQNNGKITVYNPSKIATEMVFSDLPLGYYLVVSSSGTLAALDTTNPDATVYEKNTAPSIGKSADRTNAAVGQEVVFTIKVKKGGYAWGDYVVNDVMDGLTLVDGSVKVKQGTKELTPQSDWTMTYTTDSATMKSTLQVVITQEALNRFNGGTDFTVEYIAVANKVVEMDNTVSMDYKTGPSVDAPAGQTPPHTVKVANYEFIIKKVDEKGDLLGEASFSLYTKPNCQPDSIVNFVRSADAKTYTHAPGEAKDTFRVILAGEAKIEGLAAGTYYLKEIAAPDGYNKLIDPVEIKITENLNKKEGDPLHGQAFETVNDKVVQRIDPTITIDGKDKLGDGFVLQVVNKTGAELPSTGGMGTVVFYVAGAGLMIAAAVALVAKKRMSR